MTPFRKNLLATAAAGLTLAFSTAGGALAQEKQPAAPPPGLAAITQMYHTKDSKALEALETRLNAERPKTAPRVVFVDPDIMATWLQLKGSTAAYPDMTAEYLQSKNVQGYSAEQVKGLAAASFHMTPEAAVPFAAPGVDASKLSCVVIPYNPNLSGEAFMREAFTLANPQTGKQENVSRGMKLNISISRQDMEEIVDAREAWACFNPAFVADVGQAKDFGRIMALHRLEVFQDVGGLMQAVKDGADPSLISNFADFRATAAAMTAGERGAFYTADQAPFYGSVINETSPALYDLKARIDQMGLAKFRAMSGDALVTLATEITQKDALTEAQATHIMGFAMLGAGYFHSLEIAKAPQASIDEAMETVKTALKRQDDAFARTMRPMTAEELQKSLVPLVAPQITYDLVQGKIFGDKDVQKNPDDLKARFRVHEDLVDKTRALMDQHPEAEGVIRQVLQGVFLSNPMMKKAPLPAPPANPGDSRRQMA